MGSMPSLGRDASGRGLPSTRVRRCLRT
jgi:hypothetical protein